MVRKQAAPSFSLYSAPQLEFCRALPKVELNSHLNGCIRDTTLRDLAQGMMLAGKPFSMARLVELTQQTSPTMCECFALFEIIHSVTTSHAAITRITREALEDFAADNVVYVELRTTPKCRPAHNITKESYTEAVFQGIEEYYAASRLIRSEDITVRLLLSIDRGHSAAEAEETVQLAVKLRGRGVVGVDLTGNPSLGEFDEFRPALDLARQHGLKVSLGAGEGFNPVETQKMLEWRPDRLGHCCCLNAAVKRQLLESRIPLEICLTSNVATRAVVDYSQHQFGSLYKLGHPLVICTDDSGILNTTLSREYAIATQVFGLSPQQVLMLALGAADHSFLPDAEKAALRKRMKAIVGESTCAKAEAMLAGRKEAATAVLA